jgi:glycosyltransferase involved in cell wall biosynthesis
MISKHKLLLIYSPVTSSIFWFTDNKLSTLWLCRDFSVFRLRKVPLELLSYISTDILSVQSEGLRKRYLQSYPRKTIFVTPNCVQQDSAARQTANMTSCDSKYLIYAGNWSYNKGMDMIFRLSEELRAENVEVTVVGHGVRREGKKLIKLLEHSNIRTMPRQSREELARLFDACDIFILPSRHEGSPRAVFEFLLFDKPVVSADLPGLSDINSPLLLRFEKENYDGFRAQVRNALKLNDLDAVTLQRHRDGMAAFTPEVTARAKALQIKKIISQREVHI